MMRVALATTMALDGGIRLTSAMRSAETQAFGNGALAIVLLLLSGLIAAGWFTALSATGLAIVEVAVLRSMIATNGADLQGEPMTHILRAAIAVSVALVGPGAYSIDSRLFGRREIKL
jgi:uncharacterized membrane protein YphA (DoxX/SURF4 family)